MDARSSHRLCAGARLQELTQTAAGSPFLTLDTFSNHLSFYFTKVNGIYPSPAKAEVLSFPSHAKKN